jgi:uncharacterized protein
MSVCKCENNEVSSKEGPIMRENDPFGDLIRSIEENLQRDGGWVPPEQQEPRRVPQGRPSRAWMWLLIPVALFFLFNVSLGFLTDSAWYRSLGYEAVYFTRLAASTGLFLAGTLFAWLFITLNILLARRLEPFGLSGTPPEQIAAAFGVRVPTVLIAVAAIFAFFMGVSIAGDWQQFLLYYNQVAFGVVDPIFDQDVSFFVFALPVWEMVRGWLLALLIATIAAVAITPVSAGAAGMCAAAFDCTWPSLAPCFCC